MKGKPMDILAWTMLACLTIVVLCLGVGFLLEWHEKKLMNQDLNGTYRWSTDHTVEYLEVEDSFANLKVGNTVVNIKIISSALVDGRAETTLHVTSYPFSNLEPTTTAWKKKDNHGQPFFDGSTAQRNETVSNFGIYRETK